MSEDERDLVREAVAAQKRVLDNIDQTHAIWPLGMPDWDDAWVALGLASPDGTVRLSVWKRPEDAAGTANPPADGDFARGGAAGGSVARKSPAGGSPAGETVVLPLPLLRGRELAVSAFFPEEQSGWQWVWDAAAGELTVTVPTAAPTAQVLELRPA
jgi:hypothetical protein